MLKRNIWLILLCLGGMCRYRFNERDFELHAGDLSITRKRKLIGKIEPSDDFRCKIIYAKPGFIDLCTPQSNYGIKGSLALFLNPVIHLTPEQQLVCPPRFRIAGTAHPGHGTSLLPWNAYQHHAGGHSRFFRFPRPHLWGKRYFHAKCFHYEPFSEKLEEGTYREHREVTYYADCLCVTSKYLSEVSKKVSGYAANYWINRYTILDITACSATNHWHSSRFPTCSGSPPRLISAVTCSRI